MSTLAAAPRPPSIAKVSHTHDAIMDFMLANPTASQGMVAAHFGYTQSWMSIIVNSDAFQARLRRRQDEIFGEVVVPTIRDKITGVAHRAIERLADKLEVEQDTRVIKDSAEMLLKAMGYGGQPRAQAPSVQNNVIVLADKDNLASARRLMAEAHAERVEDAASNAPIESLPADASTA